MEDIVLEKMASGGPRFKIPLQNETKAREVIHYFHAFLGILTQAAGNLTHVSGTDGEVGATYTSTTIQTRGAGSNRHAVQVYSKYTITEATYDKYAWTQNSQGGGSSGSTLCSLTIGRETDSSGRSLAILEYSKGYPEIPKAFALCFSIMSGPCCPCFFFCLFPYMNRAALVAAKNNMIGVKSFLDSYSPPQPATGVAAPQPVVTEVYQPTATNHQPAAGGNPVVVEAVPEVPGEISDLVKRF